MLTELPFTATIINRELNQQEITIAFIIATSMCLFHMAQLTVNDGSRNRQLLLTEERTSARCPLVCEPYYLCLRANQIEYGYPANTYVTSRTLLT